MEHSSDGHQILRIGNVNISPRTILAPMEGLTDAPFRSMIRSLGGCGLVVTEFINAGELSKHTRRSIQMAAIAHDRHPVAIQIYGRHPDQLAESARFCQDLGADLIDINMGCPSKAVTKHCSGVALMREPQLARHIVAAVRASINIPLTVKMRLGWDHSSVNAPAIARMCEEEGVQAVTIHGRTKADMFNGQANWERIGEVKAAVSIPVIGNGDIRTVEDALDLQRVAGVDGVMAGRGVLKNPWLLLQISQRMTGQPAFQPTVQQRRDLLLHYYGIIMVQIPHRPAALGKMKKVVGIFTEGTPYTADLRNEVFHATTVDEALDAVHRFFDRLETEGADPFPCFGQEVGA